MASWDDDDWDEEEAIKASNKAEEEATIDDLEEEARKKAEAEAAAAPKPKKKPKEKVKEEKASEDVAYDVALEDPVAEKLRRQKLVEEADARMAADLFGGCAVTPAEQARQEEAAKKKVQAEKEKANKKAKEKVQIVVKDAFDTVDLATQADVEALLGTCIEKITAGKAKGSASLFLTHLFKALEPSLSSEELKNVDKAIEGMVKAKKVDKTAADTAKRKTNEKLSKNTKFNTSQEVADVYGGGDWDEEWDEEWWDDGTAAEYAPPKR